MAQTIPLPTQCTTPPLLTLEKLSVSRGGRAILHNLSFELHRGEITALVGLNGSGKSTLLRTLLGDFPYSGAIRYRCGHDHSKPRPDYVGYVPQKLAIEGKIPFTIRDLIGVAMQRRPIFFGISRKIIEQLTPALKRVGVLHLLDVPLEGLSGGQLQRVLLALAMEPRPELLLLDEPASGIDFKDQSRFYDLIAEFNRETGVTVLLVSHDLSMVSQHANHVLCLRDGLIACEGTPREILTSEKLAAVYGEGFGAFAHSH
ncbi:MAG: metal ABC transporter ATP-binding protein [Gemmataceae bacterium]